MAGLSALVIFDTRHLSYWSDYSPGPAFAPWWIAICGLVLSAALTVQVLRAAPQDDFWTEETTPAGLFRAGLTFASLIVFLLAIPRLGLVLSSVLTAAFIMLVVLRRAVLPSLVSALISGLIIYGIFVWWLMIPVPKGPLGF